MRKHRVPPQIRFDRPRPRNWGGVVTWLQIIGYLAGIVGFFTGLGWLLGVHLSEPERLERAALWNPEWNKAQSQREMAEEMRRQNDLREQELEERRRERLREQQRNTKPTEW